jgi:hypothetical protein
MEIDDMTAPDYETGQATGQHSGDVTAIISAPALSPAFIIDE